ncbi:ArsR/SmtB family transcription factor [Kutzneria sp. CA-103260]|uniref:ArsR/SmtB family transcription factor n=1 Tax=Kutzneria sp. CA-103260 TaxID=2802641 RepID=UPI001BEF3446|nr:winged helix-turn-helix domain-containing protein [Kutzneria sp. CA-103260]QUQ72142.1 ArsR family transcriptional regulator [Kutzneria sp. CA-103260]
MPLAVKKRPATRAEAAALASDVRLRIIRLTQGRAMTNKELAAALGKDPATTLHHVRKLVDTGFLVEQPPRRGTRGSREKPYLGTQLSFGLNFEETEERAAVSEAALGAFLGEIADLGVGAADLTRVVVQLPAEQTRELLSRLHAVLVDYVDLPYDPAAERTAIFLASYRSA